MKVLFLDIDGVLNSSHYEPHTDTNGVFYFIDESRMTLLKNIIDSTGAKIVLSSTWRDAWEKKDISDISGKYIVSLFAKYGLSIYDKTPMSDNYYLRKDEIVAWLKTAGKSVTDFAILDDDDFEWGELADHVVQTNPSEGFGLEEEHRNKAIFILNGRQTHLKVSIMEYHDVYAEQFKDLLFELQSYILSLDRWGIISPNDGYREKHFKYIIKDVAEHDGVIYLAVVFGEAVGAIVCKVIEEEESGRKIGFITDLIVKKQFRCNGIAPMLMKAAEGYFKSRQCKFMQVEVFEPNVGAANLYEKYGFSEISRYLSMRLSKSKE